MSHTKNNYKLTNKSRTDIHSTEKHDNEGEIICTTASESLTYAVTISKKPSGSGEEEPTQFSGQKSFINIHSTDQLCELGETDEPNIPEECNVEVLSLNEVFPSTSEDSLSNEEELPVRKKEKKSGKNMKKAQAEGLSKTCYMPSNSKSVTGRARDRLSTDGQPSVYSDYDIPKNTLHVIGSNPGEPKMAYADAPKKISKTMKKFLRNLDKHKNEQYSKGSEKALDKLNTRGILKDGRCVPECTGDSSVQGAEEFNSQDINIPFTMDFGPQGTYNKHNLDKNVTFNTQVVIIHFTGDLCVGQSVETLSKEKDQQARNSELRKTFLTKYNEYWPTHKLTYRHLNTAAVIHVAAIQLSGIMARILLALPRTLRTRDNAFDGSAALLQCSGPVCGGAGGLLLRRK